METYNGIETSPGTQPPEIIPAQVQPAVPVPPQYAGYPLQPPAKKPPVSFDKTDSLFTGLALVIGFLFFEFVVFGGVGFGVPAFFAAAYAGILFYGSKSRSIDIKKGAPLSIPIALLLLSYVLFDNQVLGVLNLGFLFFLATLQFMSMFGVRSHEKLSKGILFDFFGGFVGKPVMNLDKLFVITAKGTKDEKGKRLFFRIMLGVVICIPLLAIILALLSSADKAFEGVMKAVTDFIGASFWEYLGKFILGFLAAIPLFGVFFAFRYKTNKGSVKIPLMEGMLDRVVAYTVMTIVCAVYLFFLFVQFNYMFFAFRGELPGGFIYSDYARRGFFELVAIAAINLGILAVFYLFTARKENKLTKVLKSYLLTLSFVTIIIIASAVSKMVMYMQVFGLTQLRVYTSWFMILLAVVFLLAIVKIISRKFNAVKILCVFFTVWFLALNFAGIDALITKYNIAKSEQPENSVLDVRMFGSLSDSMVPDAVGLLKSNDNLMKYELKIMLTERYNSLKDKSWQSMSLASIQAKKLLESSKDDYYIVYDENRHGAPGTEVEMVYRFFPGISKIESCEWYYQPSFSPDLFSRESNGIVFYGYAILSDAYFNEITTKYEWIEYDQFTKYDSWYMAQDYLSDIPQNSNVMESQAFTDDQAENSNLSMILNKYNKILYFYVEK